MKKFSEAVLAPHKHMSKKASPYHAHSMGLVYTPKGKEEVRPIDSADAGYGGEAVADAEGGEANPGKASKKAVAPMKMQTLVKANEETERERLMKLRSFVAKNRMAGLGKAMVEGEQINEMDKSQPAAGRDSDTPFPKPKPIKLTDKQRASAELMTKELMNQAKKQLKEEEAEQVDEVTQGKEYTKKQLEDKIKAGNWQTTYDIKPGKHVELTHTSGKKVSVMVREDVELDERIQANKEKWKTKLRTVGVNAAIQHPKKVQFGGGALQMGRDALKKLSSKEVSDAARKLPKVNEVNDWNGPAEENDMAMTQLHFIVYAAEEIMHAIKVGTDMEEWYQNKLSKVHSDMESLHSYMEGAKRHYGSLGDSVSEEVWDKPMPASKKQGSLSPEQKAKARARAERAGRSYPNMIDNMWASKQ